MDIRVMFFGTFRELATRDRVVALKEGAELADLIEELTNDYGEDFRNEVSKTQQTSILINGRYHSLLDDIKTQLKDGDEVAFMPLATGG